MKNVFLILVLIVFSQKAKGQLSKSEVTVICYGDTTPRGIDISFPKRNFVDSCANIVFSCVESIDTTEKKIAIEYAGRIIQSMIVSPVPINILVDEDDLSDPNYLIVAQAKIMNFAMGNYSSIFPINSFYPIALANAREGTDLFGGPEIKITLNEVLPWNTDTASNCCGRYDLVTVMIHEILHGLGICSSVKGDTIAEKANYGLLAVDSPNIYDRFIHNRIGNPMTTFPKSNNTSLFDYLTSDSIIFDGSFSNLPSANSVSIFAPRNFLVGSSIDHINEDSFPATDSNSVITPFIRPNDRVHYPGFKVRKMLDDMGWMMAPCEPNSRTTRDHSANNVLKIYQSAEHIRIETTAKQYSILNIELYSLNGEKLLQKNFNKVRGTSFRLESLNSGIYLLKTELEDHPPIFKKITILQ